MEDLSSEEGLFSQGAKMPWAAGCGTRPALSDFLMIPAWALTATPTGNEGDVALPGGIPGQKDVQNSLPVRWTFLIANFGSCCKFLVSQGWAASC